MNETINKIKAYFTEDRLSRLDSMKPIQLGKVSAFGQSVSVLNDPRLFLENQINQIEKSYNKLLDDDEQNLSYRAALNHLQQATKI